MDGNNVDFDGWIYDDEHDPPQLSDAGLYGGMSMFNMPSPPTQNGIMSERLATYPIGIYKDPAASATTQQQQQQQHTKGDSVLEPTQTELVKTMEDNPKQSKPVEASAPAGTNGVPNVVLSEIEDEDDIEDYDEQDEKTSQAISTKSPSNKQQQDSAQKDLVEIDDDEEEEEPPQVTQVSIDGVSTEEEEEKEEGTESDYESESSSSSSYSSSDDDDDSGDEDKDVIDYKINMGNRPPDILPEDQAAWDAGLAFFIKRRQCERSDASTISVEPPPRRRTKKRLRPKIPRKTKYVANHKIRVIGMAEHAAGVNAGSMPKGDVDWNGDAYHKLDDSVAIDLKREDDESDAHSDDDYDSEEYEEELVPISQLKSASISTNSGRSKSIKKVELAAKAASDVARDLKRRKRKRGANSAPECLPEGGPPVRMINPKSLNDALSVGAKLCPSGPELPNTSVMHNRPSHTLPCTDEAGPDGDTNVAPIKARLKKAYDWYTEVDKERKKRGQTAKTSVVFRMCRQYVGNLLYADADGDPNKVWVYACVGVEGKPVDGLGKEQLIKKPDDQIIVLPKLALTRLYVHTDPWVKSVVELAKKQPPEWRPTWKNIKKLMAMLDDNSDGKPAASLNSNVLFDSRHLHLARINQKGRASVTSSTPPPKEIKNLTNATTVVQPSSQATEPEWTPKKRRRTAPKPPTPLEQPVEQPVTVPPTVIVEHSEPKTETEQPKMTTTNILLSVGAEVVSDVSTIQSITNVFSNRSNVALFLACGDEPPSTDSGPDHQQTDDAPLPPPPPQLPDVVIETPPPQAKSKRKRKRSPRPSKPSVTHDVESPKAKVAKLSNLPEPPTSTLPPSPSSPPPPPPPKKRWRVHKLMDSYVGQSLSCLSSVEAGGSEEVRIASSALDMSDPLVQQLSFPGVDDKLIEALERRIDICTSSPPSDGSMDPAGITSAGRSVLSATTLPNARSEFVGLITKIFGVRESNALGAIQSGLVAVRRMYGTGNIQATDIDPFVADMLLGSGGNKPHHPDPVSVLLLVCRSIVAKSMKSPDMSAMRASTPEGLTTFLEQRCAWIGSDLAASADNPGSFVDRLVTRIVQTKEDPPVVLALAWLMARRQIEASAT